jgi:hypothetical protein
MNWSSTREQEASRQAPMNCWHRGGEAIQGEAPAPGREPETQIHTPLELLHVIVRQAPCPPHPTALRGAGPGQGPLLAGRDARRAHADWARCCSPRHTSSASASTAGSSSSAAASALLLLMAWTQGGGRRRRGSGGLGCRAQERRCGFGGKCGVT